MEDPVRASQLVDVFAQQFNHQRENFAVLGEDDVRPDVIMAIPQGKRPAEPAWHGGLFEQFHAVYVVVLLQKAGQRDSGQPST